MNTITTKYKLPQCFMACVLMVLAASLHAQQSAQSSDTAAPLMLAGIQLQDQHDKPHTLSAQHQRILFTHDMSGKDVVELAFEKNAPAQAWLDEHHAVYIANIGGMPSLISRLFAYPAMRKKPYNIWLDTDGNITKQWPTQDDAVTLLHLKEGRVIKTQFIERPEQLINALNN